MAVQIENLATYKGRILLSKIFHSLRYEKQRSAFSVFFICLGICISGKNIDSYIDEDIKINYTLGVRRGIALWLEEILNRYYFSAINSFVYFGAAILLVLIALQRFSDIVDSRIVIGGVILESSMLVMMFIVMLFTPNEDLVDEKEEIDSGELIDEIGEIGSEFAQAVIQLENIAQSIDESVKKQEALIEKVDQSLKVNIALVNPNPEMINIMGETNKSIEIFKASLDDLTKATKQLEDKQIEAQVRKEIERIVKNNLGKEA